MDREPRASRVYASRAGLPELPEALSRWPKDHADFVQRGLKLKKAGNEIIKTIGGREIHPINMRVGGFYKAPSKGKSLKFIEPLKWARDAATATVGWDGRAVFPRLRAKLSLCRASS